MLKSARLRFQTSMCVSKPPRTPRLWRRCSHTTIDSFVELHKDIMTPRQRMLPYYSHLQVRIINSNGDSKKLHKCHKCRATVLMEFATGYCTIEFPTGYWTIEFSAGYYISLTWKPCVPFISSLSSLSSNVPTGWNRMFSCFCSLRV